MNVPIQSITKMSAEMVQLDGQPAIGSDVTDSATALHSAAYSALSLAEEL